MVLSYRQKFRTKHVRWSPNWAYWVSNWANWCSNLISPIKYFLCFTNDCFMKVYNVNSIKTKSILDIKRPLLEQKKIISFERKIDMICKCGSRGQVHGLFVSSSWFKVVKDTGRIFLRSRCMISEIPVNDLSDAGNRFWSFWLSLSDIPLPR